MAITPLRHRLSSIARARWLRNFWLYRLIWTIALHFDVLIDLALQAVRLRFPSQAVPDALPFLCQERGVRRGLGEPDSSLIARLHGWIPAHARKGSPFAMAEQIQAYLHGYPVMVRVYNNDGACATRTSSGVETFTQPGTPGTQWDWDGLTADWSRFWVVVYSDGGPWTQDLSTWGSDSEKWGDTGTWGSDATQNNGANLKYFASAAGWGAPHAACQMIMISFDYAQFLPNGTDMPHGTWGKWYTLSGGVAVPSRAPTVLYITGVA